MKRTSPALDPSQTGWLLAAAAIAMLPLTPHLPLWLTVAATLALLLHGWLVHARARPLARWLMFLLVAAGTAGILAQYRTLFGQQPGVAMLAMFLTLKLHEARAHRDGMAIILLCYFISLTTFFYSQSMANGTLLLGAILAATAAMMKLTDSRLPTSRLLRQSATMLAQATPFLLILFLLFPRISGPLWGLPRDAHSALSGLADTMSPGTISNLSQSDAIAFRVKFEGKLPARDQLYWRGPVLTAFDGRTWSRIPTRARREFPYEVPQAGGYRYEVTLEPNNQPWLFALEFPSELPPDSTVTDDYQLLAATPVNQRQRYAVLSHTDQAADNEQSRWIMNRSRFLPRGGNPRIRAAAAEWAGGGADDQTILRNAIRFFQRQRLAYTLTPPLLGDDAVDEFLFDTRQGFCEHFAGAFVFALRAAGLPARVVTGYQGGEINPVDGYLTVRQSDAHAWAEVWLQGRGWVRTDPTAASYPLRIEMNLAAVVPDDNLLPLLMRVDLPWLRDLRFRWDAVTNAWNQWVIGYTPQRQREFLSRLGMRSPDWQHMTLLLSVLCGAVVLALTAWTLSQRRRVDPALRLWRKVQAKLERRGIPCPPWEGPQDCAARVSTVRPEFSAAIREIAETYGKLRYGDADESALERLRTHIAAFKP